MPNATIALEDLPTTSLMYTYSIKGIPSPPMSLGWPKAHKELSLAFCMSSESLDLDSSSPLCSIDSAG